MYAPSLKLTFSHLKKTGWLECRNTSFLFGTRPHVQVRKCWFHQLCKEQTTFQRVSSQTNNTFSLSFVFGFVFKVCPWECPAPGPQVADSMGTATNRYQFFSGGATPRFWKRSANTVVASTLWIFLDLPIWVPYMVPFQGVNPPSLTVQIGTPWKELLSIFHAWHTSKHVWRVTMIPEHVHYISPSLKTNSSHLKMTPGKGESYWKPPCLGAMLVLGRVYSIWHSQEQCFNYNLCHSRANSSW